MPASKSYYVATAIPYVNDVPHVGFAYELIIADVLNRYHRGQGKDTFFSTGTDEHGGKIAAKAEALGVTPKELVDKNSLSYRDLAPALGVEFTKFIRTTDEEHESRVAKIWQSLSEFIYKSSYVGLYDQREEAFISEDDAKEIKKRDPARYETLHRLEEENYFFKLSHFSSEVLKSVESGHLKILPLTRRNEILNLLRGGLEDISISRPTEKMAWGISVPGDPTHTIYVWFEALLNYITTLGYPDDLEQFNKFWPCNTQVIGKDVVRFHAAIWPAMLMALELPLPKEIYVHGFLTVNNQKMSKSVGNVISPLDLVSKFGSEATRYYLMRHIPSYEDGDFTWEKMEAAYNGELGNDLGNLIQRVQTMVKNFLGGEFGDLPESDHDDATYHEAFSSYRLDKAIDFCWDKVKGLNQYIDQEKPWTLKDESEKAHLREVLAYVVKSLLQLGDLLAPFLPETSLAIQSIFGGDELQPSVEMLFPRVNIVAEE